MSRLHREHPEKTDEEIALLHFAGERGVGLPPTDGVTRECRDCGTPFLISLKLAGRPVTKWTALCPSCLAHHL